MNFEDLIAKVKTCGKQKLAVAAAEDDAVLEAVDAAHKQGIADAILVGDEAAIRKIAAELNIDLTDYEIINEPDKVQASLTAVKLAHDGAANMYMKGLLDTKTFLKSVLDKEVGLRTGKTLSHVAVFEVKGIEQLLFLTDVAFMTYPTLEDKVHIIENTVAVAHACGVECPKVAPLAAVEVVNPKMPCTVDAEELRKMNAEGKITGCVVDGPLSHGHCHRPRSRRSQRRPGPPRRRPCRHPAVPRHPGRQPGLQDAGPHRRVQERLHSDRHPRARHPDQPFRFLPDQGQFHRAGRRGGRRAENGII